LLKIVDDSTKKEYIIFVELSTYEKLSYEEFYENWPRFLVLFLLMFK